MTGTTEAPRLRVLLVDDDAAVAKALAAILSRAGYEVTVAATPREAEARLDHRFDVLLLDLRMPGMRGDALFFVARARQPWLAAHTLFMTGDITPIAEAIVAETRCPLLLKPFRSGELLAAIERLLPRVSPSSAAAS